LVFSRHDIILYGAIHNDDSTEAAFLNSAAMVKAITQANSTEDREVVIPAGHSFTMMPFYVQYLNNVTIIVEGNVFLSQDFNRMVDSHFWVFEDSRNLHFKGSGTIDGNGYAWWWRDIMQIGHG
jgi:hypothetical protein